MSKKPTNKGRRNELARLKKNKRCKLFGVDPNRGHVYKNHGKPCSCWACRNEKYKRNRQLNLSGSTEQEDIEAEEYNNTPVVRASMINLLTDAKPTII